MKQWVQPPINKNRLAPGGFLIRVPSPKFYFYLYYQLRCHWNIGGTPRNPLFDNTLYRYNYINFNKGFNQN